MAEILVLTRHMLVPASDISTAALAPEYIDDDSPNNTNVKVMKNLLEGAFLTSSSRNQSRMLEICRKQG